MSSFIIILSALFIRKLIPFQNNLFTQISKLVYLTAFLTNHQTLYFIYFRYIVSTDCQIMKNFHYALSKWDARFNKGLPYLYLVKPFLKKTKSIFLNEFFTNINLNYNFFYIFKQFTKLFKVIQFFAGHLLCLV